MDDGANFGPVENFFGIGFTHVDTAVRHRGAKIVVPPGTMNAVVFEKIHGVKNIGKGVFFCPCATGHGSGIEFEPNSEFAGNGGVSSDTRRNKIFFNNLIAFVGIKFLFGEDN